MTVKKAARFIVYALSWLCASTFSAVHGEDIPQPELARLLSAAGMPLPWHIDQLGFENNGWHWQVDLYYDPRRVSQNICIANMITTDFSRTSNGYVLEDSLAPQPAVALENCNTIKTRGHFTTLDEGISDEQLKAAVHTAFALKAGKSAAEVQFETQDLKDLLPEIQRDHLHWIQKSSEGSVVLSFFSRDISPDLLAIRINDRRDAAYVYRENGPDIVSLKR